MPKQSRGFKRRQSANSLSGHVQGLLGVSASTNPSLVSDPLSTVALMTYHPFQALPYSLTLTLLPANTFLACSVLGHIIILLYSLSQELYLMPVHPLQSLAQCIPLYRHPRPESRDSPAWLQCPHPRPDSHSDRKTGKRKQVPKVSCFHRWR